MATRSFIAVLRDNGYNAIYCHWDGYLDGVGKNLLNNFNTLEEVNQLIAGGDASSIDENGEVNYYQTPDSSYCFCSNYDDLIETAKNCGTEYLYVFAENQWYYQKIYGDHPRLEILAEWFEIMEPIQQ